MLLNTKKRIDYLHNVQKTTFKTFETYKNKQKSFYFPTCKI